MVGTETHRPYSPGATTPAVGIVAHRPSHPPYRPTFLLPTTDLPTLPMQPNGLPMHRAHRHPPWIGRAPTDPHTHRPQRPTRPTTRPTTGRLKPTDHVPPMLRRDIGLPSYRPTVLPDNLPSYRPRPTLLPARPYSPTHPAYRPTATDHTRLPTTAHVT
jgi:hypothetical protein